MLNKTRMNTSKFKFTQAISNKDSHRTQAKAVTYLPGTKHCMTNLMKKMCELCITLGREYEWRNTSRLNDFYSSHEQQFS